MGAYTSIPVCKAKYNVMLDCTLNLSADPPIIGGVEKGNFGGDPDVAGIGVVYAFIAVTSFTFVLCSLYLVWHVSKWAGWKKRFSEEEKIARGDHAPLSEYIETVIISCSDQQVFTGGAYALTLRYWKGCSISAYHYNIVANMLLLTCATHLMSLTISTKYWRLPLMGILRIIITAGVFVVTGLLLANQNALALADSDGQPINFPTGIPPDGETNSPIFLMAACFQDRSANLSSTLDQTFSNRTSFFQETLLDSSPGNRIHGWNFWIVMLLFYAAAVLVGLARRIATWKIEWKERLKHTLSQSFSLCGVAIKSLQALWAIYVAGSLVICGWTIYDCANYIRRLRDWVNKSGWIDTDQMKTNPEDDPTTFGQLIPIFLICLTVFTFLQLLGDQMREKAEQRKVRAESVAGRSRSATPAPTPGEKSISSFTPLRSSTFPMWQPQSHSQYQSQQTPSYASTVGTGNQSTSPLLNRGMSTPLTNATAFSDAGHESAYYSTPYQPSISQSLYSSPPLFSSNSFAYLPVHSGPTVVDVAGIQPTHPSTGSYFPPQSYEPPVQAGLARSAVSVVSDGGQPGPQVASVVNDSTTAQAGAMFPDVHGSQYDPAMTDVDISSGYVGYAVGGNTNYPHVVAPAHQRSQSSLNASRTPGHQQSQSSLNASRSPGHQRSQSSLNASR